MMSRTSRTGWMSAVGVMAVVAGVASNVRAQNWNWIGAAGGNWDTTTNWSPNTVPNSATGTVTINNGSTAIGGGVTRLVGAVNLIGAASSITVGNGSRLSLNNTLACTGTIFVQSTGSTTYLQPVGNISLIGNGGALVLSANANNIIFDQANSNNAADTLTVFNGFTVRGAGSIGAGAGLAVVNAGLIHADTSAAPLRLRPASLSNANGAILRASNGATLSVESVLSSTGALESLSSSTIEFNGATGTNGTITGTGRLRATGATTNVSLSAVRVGALEIINNATQRIGNAGASKVTTLTINTGGKLDLVSGTMIIDYTGASPAATIRSQITTGRNAGAWNGPGIHSSLLATLPSYGVAYAEASQLGLTTLGGQSVDATSIVTGIAFLGDTDLNGQVAFSDLLALAQNYSSTATGREWTTGDFNYDGKADFSDLLSLAQNYNASSVRDSGDSLAAAGVGASFLTDFALAQSLVPEPTTLIAGLASVLQLTRRRR